MSKQPDFGNDLEALKENVSAEVGDVLQVLQQKRTANRHTVVINKREPITEASESTAHAAVAREHSPVPHLPRRHRPTSRSPLPLADTEDALENVTTRLPRKINELLTEAALRQRLKKESPSTRQAIVEVELHDWFRKHRYVAGRDDESLR